MPISIVPMTEEEIKKNEKKPKRKKPQKANKVNSGQKPKGLLTNKTGGLVKRMGGGKTSKYKAKGGMVKRMAGGKTSKYKAKGGTVGKMGGGIIGFKKTSKY